MQQTTRTAAGMLLGRRTYEILTDAWATADDADPTIAAMNQMPKYVVSSTGERLGWHNSHWIGDDAGPAVTTLKSRTTGDLVVFGAGSLIRGLAAHDLIDEYRLLLFPIVLGSGKRMFDDHGQLAQFTLTDSVIAASGVAILTYTRRDPD